MLNWFKKKTQQSVSASASSGMSDDLAQTAVMHSLIGWQQVPPLSATRGPCPLLEGHDTGCVYQAHRAYEGMRRISEELFRSKGYDETVQQLRAMSMRLDDWHDIDPEDRDAVAHMNAVQGPPPEWAMPIIGKYMQRSLDK